MEKRSGAVNENLKTGEIEVIPEELRILSESETPPFPIEENSKTKEEVRLKYRYLDLRRPDLQRNLLMRSQVATLTRQFLAEEGISGDRDADADRQHPGGSQGLSGAQPDPSREVSMPFLSRRSFISSF